MPEKLYKIGEAAQMLNLKSYVLRFWESEFPQLRPTRTESGQRLYTEQNLELLKRIRHLLHERGLTIEGARKILSDPQYAQAEGQNGSLLDEGLSSDLLDEGYKDFIAGLDPDDDNYAASGAVRNSADAAAPDESIVAALEAKNALLDHLLIELKSLRALFPEAAKNNPR